MLQTLKHFFKKKLTFKRGKPSNKGINHNNKGVINLIDIGSVGLLPEPWLSNAYIIKTLLKFEPRDQAEKKNNIVSLDVALWNTNEELDFYIYKGLNQTGSSLFKQNYQYVKDNFKDLKTKGPSWLAETWFDRSELIAVEKLKCRALDEVLKENSISTNFHFIKIDAQGAEFQILKGAESVLKNNCIGLHLELFNIPLYEGITLLPEVVSYLKDLGFELVKKFPAHGSFDSQHDCVFLKKAKANSKEFALIKNIYKIN